MKLTIAILLFAVLAAGQVGSEEPYIKVEYYPSLEKALERMNRRSVWMNSNGEVSQTEPELKSSDVIGLFKVQRIPVQVKATNKKAKVMRQVEEYFEEPVLEWQP
jgi:hypothetical protein